MIASHSSVAALVLSPDKVLGAPVGMSRPVGAPSSLGSEMNFVMQQVEYDRHTGRAYVEFRGPDDDGGDAIATAIFSYSPSD